MLDSNTTTIKDISPQDVYLLLLRHLHESEHVVTNDVKLTQGITAYHSNSCLKAEELLDYGPLSCLSQQEKQLGGFRSHVCIGSNMSMMPWQIGMISLISICLHTEIICWLQQRI